LSSTPNIEVRLAAAGDGRAIAALLSESFVEFQPLYTPEGYAATSITPAEVATRIEEGPVWVAVRDGIFVGTVSVISKGESLYIRGMAVLPAARGQRIGELLLGHIEKFAADGTFRRLLLSTTPFLDRAIRLYEHFGFRRTTEGPHELFGTPLLSMEKLIERK
jgi:GNAT superfamily N-acetyltransferase